MADNLGRRRWWALAPLVLAGITLGFDVTILNVALPTIAAELDAGTAGLQWMVNGYVLPYAALMVPFAASGDRYGRKKLLLAGLVAFAAASLLAALAGSVGQVIAGRAIMGIAAAVVTPLMLAVLPVLFPDQNERAKALSIVVGALGVGLPLGPLVGGWLLEHFSWGSIFLVNVPVGLLTVAATIWLLPESRDPDHRRPDLPGALLSVASLLGLVYGIIEAPRRGWGDPQVLAAITVGMLLLAGFTWWQRHTWHPMIDLWLFRRRQFLAGSLAAAVASFALLGLLFVVPQYLQHVAGDDPFAVGLRLLPMIAGVVAGAALGERLALLAGYRLPVAAGLLVAAAGLALGATTNTTTGYGLVAAWLAATGVGVGAALAPAVDAVLAELPQGRSATGMAIAFTFRYVGGALGVALLGSVLQAGYTDRLDTTGLPPPVADAAAESITAALAAAARVPGLAAGAQAAFVHAMVLVLLTCAAITIAGAVLTACLMPRNPSPTDATPRRAQATTSTSS